MTLRIAVTAVLLAGMFLIVDVSELMTVVARLSLPMLAVAIAVLAVQRVIAVLRWQIILAAHGIRSSFPELTRITLISHSIGHMSPGGLGVEVARAWQAGAAWGEMSMAVSSVVLDRVIGLVSMLVIALVIALVLSPGMPDLQPIAWACGVGLVAVAGFVAVLNTRVGRQLIGRLPRRLHARIGPALDKLVVSLARHGRDFRLVAWIAVLSLVMQSFRAVTVWIIFMAMGTDVSLLHCLVFVPLVYVLLAVPVSLGGLGVREGALAFFFAQVGVPPEVSVAAGLVLYALQLVFVLPGLAMFLARPVRSASGTACRLSERQVR